MKMISFLLAMSFKSVKSLNPIFMAFLILVLSVASSFFLFKSSQSSWISFVVILTFSSGMMTLFIYTASLSSNEIQKSNKIMWVFFLIFVLMMIPFSSTRQFINKSMIFFSNSMILILLAAVLLLTLLVISKQGHHPNQTVSTSF